MSAHVLLNLLKELEKRDKRRDLSSILSLFRNRFNKFNITGARMLDSIYHMTLSLFCKKVRKTARIRNPYNQVPRSTTPVPGYQMGK